MQFTELIEKLAGPDVDKKVIIQEMMEFIEKNNIRACSYGIDKFWTSVRDLFLSGQDYPVPLLCEFLNDIHLDRLVFDQAQPTLRDIFTIVMMNGMETSLKLHVFRLLFDDGKYVVKQSVTLGWYIGVLHDSIELSEKNALECLEMILGIVIHQDLQENDLIKLIETLVDTLKDPRLIVHTLKIHQELVKQGPIPLESIKSFVYYLCQAVNLETSSVDIMNTLLSLSIGNYVYSYMVEMVSHISSDNVALIRGTIYFLGYFGYKKPITNIEVSNEAILQSMVAVLLNTKGNEAIQQLILELLQKMISTQFDTLFFEWDTISAILTKMPKNPLLLEILQFIRELFKNGRYFGNLSDYFEMEKFDPDLAMLAKRIHPAHHEWKSDLAKFVSLLKVDARGLEYLKEFLLSFTMIADEVLDSVIPVFDYKPGMSHRYLNSLETIIHEIPTKRFLDLVHLLEKYVHQKDDDELSTKALESLIAVFKTRPEEVFTIVVPFLKHSKRERVLCLLLSLKANRNYQVELDGVMYPSVSCHAEKLLRTTGGVLPIPLLIDALMDQIQVEDNQSLLLLIFVGLKDIFINKYILRDYTISKMIPILCKVCMNRFEFISSDWNCLATFLKMLTVLIGFSSRFSESERVLVLQTFLFCAKQILTNPDRFKKEEQSWERLIRYCLDALNICLSEMTKESIQVIPAVTEVVTSLFERNATSVYFTVYSYLHHLATINQSHIGGEKIFWFVLKYVDYSSATEIVLRLLGQWFIKSDLSTRQVLLKQAIPVLIDVLNPHIQTLVDFMLRYSFMTIEQNVFLKDYIDKIFNGFPYKAWTIGNGILTAQSGKYGYVLLRYRRPTGIVMWTMKLLNNVEEKEETVNEEQIDETVTEKRVEIDTFENVPRVTTWHALSFKKEKEPSPVRSPVIDSPYVKDLNHEREPFIPVRRESVNKTSPLMTGGSIQQIKLDLQAAVQKSESKEMKLESMVEGKPSTESKTPEIPKTQSPPHSIPSSQISTPQFGRLLEKEDPEFIYTNLSITEPKEVHRNSPRLYEKISIDKSSLNPNFPYIYLRNWPWFQDKAVGLKKSDALTRALNMLDLISGFSTSKFGVIYVAKRQTNQSDILKNTHGSPRYFEFLKQLGTFTTLRELEGQFSAGLDTSETLMDGDYCLMYKDEIQTIIYHVATLMPNHKNDEQSISKKRHIGNDFVTIVYSENEHVYDDDTLTGEFNFIHIVIYPHEKGWNRVEVIVRKDITDLAHFGPLKRFQIVSDAALSQLVILTATHANIAVNSYRESKKQYKSNWEERLRQIETIKQRHSRPNPTEGESVVETALNDFFEM